VLAASGSGAGQVRNPNGLAIDCRMNLHVADTGNNRILTIVTADSTMIPNTGTVLAGSGAGLNPAQVTAPQGVAVDSAGRLYIADTGNNRVLTMASAPAPGAASTLCTLGGALGQVRGPEGVTITAFTSGPLAGVPSVVVSDTTNNRIQARSLLPGPWMLLGGPAQLKLPSKVR
jgi:sugar lactone lactonase YvrE